MRLIVNGDDFGLTEGVTNGIIKAMKEGIMTETSAMVNMPYFEEAIKKAKLNGIDKMGIHLTLTCGEPVLDKSEIGSLLDENGSFHRHPDPDYIDVVAAEKEIRAQINKFLKTGMKLDHIDSHHHFYMYSKGYLDIVVKLAKEYNVPIRCMSSEKVYPYAKEYKFTKDDVYEDSIGYVRKNNVKCPDYLILDFYDTGVSEENLISMLKELMGKYDTVEIMSHPAIVDDELCKRSSYNVKREKEVQVLTSKAVKDFIKENNIELIDYTQL